MLKQKFMRRKAQAFLPGARRLVLITVLMLLTSLMLTACYFSVPLPSELDPASKLDFGTLGVGNSASLPLSIFNVDLLETAQASRLSDMEVSQPVITGPNAQDFWYTASPAQFPVTLAAGLPPCVINGLPISAPWCGPANGAKNSAEAVNSFFKAYPQYKGIAESYLKAAGNSSKIEMPIAGTLELQVFCRPSALGLRQAVLEVPFTGGFTPNPQIAESPTEVQFVAHYPLACTGEEGPFDPAVSLAVSPDRMVANDADNLIAYGFKVKNRGQGKGNYLHLTLPVDPDLVVGYTKFENNQTWVTKITDNAVVIDLPDLLANQEVSGTIYLRPRTNPAPAPGTRVETRLTLRYDDPFAVGLERQSNSVTFTFTGAGGNFSAEGVQIITPGEASGKVGEQFRFGTGFMAPNEEVTVWLTGPDGKSFQLTGVDVKAGSKGEFNFTVNSAGLLPGVYYVALRGDRTGVTGNAKLTLTAPSLAPAGASLKAGEKVTFTGTFLAAGETASAWLTGPDGKSTGLSGHHIGGLYSLDLDTTGLNPGTYTLVVKGETSGLQAVARVDISRDK